MKADVFRLAYLIGIRKGQLRRTRKRHVLIQGDVWKLKWSAEETKNGEPHVVVLGDEECAIVQRAWAARLPDCDFLFHVNGKPLGPMLSELKRTCALLDIPYGRASGVVWHDTRHAAVTNLVGAGVPEVVAMSIRREGSHDLGVSQAGTYDRGTVRGLASAFHLLIAAERTPARHSGDRGADPRWCGPTLHDSRSAHASLRSIRFATLGRRGSPADSKRRGPPRNGGQAERQRGIASAGPTRCKEPELGAARSDRRSCQVRPAGG